MIARQDRIQVWSLPYLFVVVIGLGFLFTFYDIFDINVSFLQTCTQIVSGCYVGPPPVPAGLTEASELLGLPVLAATLAVTAVALITGGAAVGRLTGKSILRSGLRQLALGGLAIAVTFTVGSLIGSHAA